MNFLDKVIIRDRLVRKSSDNQTYWESQEVPPSIGVFLGTRITNNGQTKDDLGFVVNERFKVALVCDHPERNPFYCTIDRLTKV